MKKMRVLAVLFLLSLVATSYHSPPPPPKGFFGILAVSHKDTDSRFFPPNRQGSVSLIRWNAPKEWGLPEKGFDVYRCIHGTDGWKKLTPKPILPINKKTVTHYLEGSPELSKHPVDGRTIAPCWRIQRRTAEEIIGFVSALPGEGDRPLSSVPAPGGISTGFLGIMMSSLQLMNMAAVDPGIAYAIGFLFADYEAPNGEDCCYKVVGNWTTHGLHEVSIGPVRRGRPMPLGPPKDLAAALLPCEADGISAARAADQMQVGLSWYVPDPKHVAIAPPPPLLWHVFRTPNPIAPVSAAAATVTAPGTPEQYTEVSVNQEGGRAAPAPILVSFSSSPIPGEPDRENRTLPKYFFRDDLGTTASGIRFHFGWHAYRIQGMDIFGRITSWSTPLKVLVKDCIPPPPPADFVGVTGTPAATLAQTTVPLEDAKEDFLDDPLRENTERVLAKTRVRMQTKPSNGAGSMPLYQDPGTMSTKMTLRWRWTQAQSDYAPDIHHFEIFKKKGDSRVQGRTIAVAGSENWVRVGEDIPAPALGGPPLLDYDPINFPKVRWNYQQIIQIGLDRPAEPPLGDPTHCRNVWYFRIVSVDTNGNRSAPTPPAMGAVHDLLAPSAPGKSTVLYSRRSGTGLLGVHILQPYDAAAVPLSPVMPRSDVAGYRLYRMSSPWSPQYPTAPLRDPLHRAPKDAEDLLLTAELLKVPESVALANSDQQRILSTLRSLALAGNLFRSDASAAKRAGIVSEADVNDLLAGKLLFEDAVDESSVACWFFWHATAVDRCGNASPLGYSIIERIPDWTPPSRPLISKALAPVADAGADATAVPTCVQLSWAPNSEPDVVRYRIGRAEGIGHCSEIASFNVTEASPLAPGTSPAAPTDGRKFQVWSNPAAPTGRRTQFHFRDLDMQAPRTYTYVIRAEDDAGNISEPSRYVECRAVDTTPPVPPASLTVTTPGGVAALTWTAKERGLRVRVQRGPSLSGPWENLLSSDTIWTQQPISPPRPEPTFFRPSRGPAARIPAPAEPGSFRYVFDDTAPVPAPQSSYYRVRLVDASGNQSDWTTVRLR